MNMYEYFERNYELIKREQYRECSLSNETKKILCDIGLPKEPLNFIQFNIDEIEIELNDRYIVIGNDFGTDICINEKEEIISIDKENEYPIRFVNKSLKDFLECIFIYKQYEQEINNVADDDIESILDEIKMKFEIIDKEVFNNEENWWSIILEQIELGMM